MRDDDVSCAKEKGFFSSCVSSREGVGFRRCRSNYLAATIGSYCLSVHAFNFASVNSVNCY